ncbi:protein-L-isoaspartate O-methyltransferase [Altererythrobacter sp. JGD-16]|uniref:Protein-L-isoaspartate O-methyltransferase n=2 Tax=Altererythrobacter lutimaris TaxID=2743979 RepID=A0A850HE23_9SPHN|nr:protein-L-isoaspartate O-methyltransferase [Altererythrobacter lutimaris]
MIDSQLRTSGINDPWVLARMAAVPREKFVPEAQRDIAYMDRAVPLGDGTFLASPLVHGMMLTEAAPRRDDTVLIVESGTSYLAELVRPLVASLETRSAEEIAASKSARKAFSLVLVDGAMEAMNSGLSKRLEEGGRIVTGVVERGVTRLAVGRKTAGSVTLQPVADVGIPVLKAFEQAKNWSF